MKQTYINLLLTVLSFTLLLPISSVLAHSTLIDTKPQGGEEMNTSPKSIEIWFKDPVSVHSESIQIYDQQGKKLTSIKPEVDPSNKEHVTAMLNEALSPGGYIVKINVIAPDGDILNEEFHFTVLQEVKKTTNEPLELIRAFPADGETTAQPINKLDLWFNQAIDVTTIGLFNDKKIQMNTKKPIIDPNDPTHVIVETYDDLPSGTYQISWFGKSLENGEQLLDSIGIYYFAVETFTPMNPLMSKPPIKWLENVGLKQFSYWISFVGLSLAFGLAFFQKWVLSIGNTEHKRFNAVYYSLSALSVVGISLFLIELRKEVTEIPFQEFLQLKFTWIPLLQIALILVSLITKRFALYLFGICLFIWPFVVGHSSYPRYGGWLTMIVNEFHLFAVSIWLGGLFVLITFGAKNTDANWLKEAAYRFSKWGVLCIIVIALTGVWMSLQYIPSFSLESIVRSVFGRALLFKILLFLIMIIFAFFNRKMIGKLSAELTRRFIFKVRTEFLYGIFVLFFAAILVVSTPSAAEQGIYPETITKNGVELSVDVEPFFPGFSTMTLDFHNNPEIAKAIVTLSMPPDYVKTNVAFKVGQGEFKLTGMLLHAAGTVEMEVQAITTGGETIIFPVKIVVPGEMRLNE